MRAMQTSNRGYWEVIDPNNVLCINTTCFEAEATVAAFIARLYAQALEKWDTLPHAVCLPRSSSSRRDSDLARELCAPMHATRVEYSQDRERVYELTREMCESSDSWEVLVGEKLYRYLCYFVDSAVSGLKREDAAQRLHAARRIFERCTDGVLDPDSFFRGGDGTVGGEE